MGIRCGRITIADDPTLDDILDMWEDPKMGRRQVEDILDMLVVKRATGKAKWERLLAKGSSVPVDDKFEEMYELRLQGMSYRLIAKQMGVSQSKVFNDLRRKVLEARGLKREPRSGYHRSGV